MQRKGTGNNDRANRDTNYHPVISMYAMPSWLRLNQDGSVTPNPNKVAGHYSSANHG